ncbi:hypothetical protein [Flavobacterium sp. UBA7682]|uniref:hypothetical protein n=1 Tax=Flavobacterium sp. UBA7682 TaxID=1946560 RepID=UPI0025BDA94E|nr:hypothetical protein [Flavobacterium sp. UBA7682]
MKTALTIIFFFVSLKAYQQSENIGQPFVLKASTNATFVKFIANVSLDTALPANTAMMAQSKVLYILQSVDKANGVVYFYADNFNLSKTEADRGTNRDKSFYYNDKLLKMSYNDYKSNAKDVEFPDGVNFGILTLPFKYRPQKDADFETQFNLNTTFGILIRNKYFKKAKFYAQLGAGIGTVKLDASNASGVTDDDAQNVSTITGFMGLMMQYNDIQAGIYLGAEQINNNKKYGWENQGNLWISLGVGFKIFTLSKSDKNKNE